MARMPRVEFDGALYHLLCRGDRREAIFRDDKDREIFLATLGEICQRNGWRVHAYVLMSNHYHLLVETPKANLVRGMHWFQATYTARYNRRHRLSGHLFAGRYKSLLIDPEERGYLATVSDYIHLNPARVHLTGEKPLGNYRWSSLSWYGPRARNRPNWLEVKSVLGELGWSDRASHRREYLKRLQERARENPPGESLGPVPRELRRGWILGGEQFRDRMLGLMDRLSDAGVRKSGPVETWGDHGAWTAARLLRAGLKQWELEKSDLRELRKNDWRKRLIGHLIKKRSGVSLRWIGEHLVMGNDSHVSRLCSRIDDLANQPQLSKHLKEIEARARQE
jgi:REP element-mobilizing transposase RayT